MEKKGKVLMERYEFGRLLGQGNFAKVYYAKDIQTGKTVAVKVLDIEKVFKARLIEQTKREISVMKMVKHPNVLELYEVTASKTKIYYIMEYAKGGELFNKLSKGRFNEADARKYFHQLISAISFCHRMGVYHRDLKLENLLLDENGDLKVSDFGFSAVFESKRLDGLLHTACGTPAYVAPEVLSLRGYDGAISDIWSCGVILYTLLAGYLPFRESNLLVMYKRISRGDYKCPSWISLEARRLLAKILNPNPKTRISVSAIMIHPWFQNELTDDSEVSAEVEAADQRTATETSKPIPDPKAEKSKLNQLNAFDIISLSAGFDLSGLFSDVNNTLVRDEAQFTSTRTASQIMSKFKDISKKLQLNFTINDGGFLRLEKLKDYPNESLSINVKISEFTSSFHLVELSMVYGDILKFHMLLKDDIRPALGDVVWAWQGDQELKEPRQ